ncbi:MAG: class I SAM-dependent methyltransferase [Desulfobulbus sp.]
METQPAGGPLLCQLGERLEFRVIGDPELTGALWVDFDSAAARRRSLHTVSELLIRAAKIRRMQNNPLLIDATAGLGRDAFLLATHGFRVQMIEINPVVAALLADGLDRAGRLPHLQMIAARIQLRRGNSVAIFAALEERPDVIYLDPMFPERSKSAKVKQNLRLLQYLDDHAIAPEELLHAALAVDAKKVVIKRPLKGPPLAGKKPSYTLKGKAIRFDVYLGTGEGSPP